MVSPSCVRSGHAVRGELALEPLRGGHGLLCEAGFVLRVGQVVEHGELEPPVAARVGERRTPRGSGGSSRRRSHSPPGRRPGRGGGRPAPRRRRRRRGGPRRVTACSSISAGSPIRRNSAESRRWLLREQGVVAVLLGPALDLAHDPRAVLGVPEARLRGALREQPALVEVRVRVHARDVELVAGARQRRPCVVPQQILDVLDRAGRSCGPACLHLSPLPPGRPLVPRRPADRW